MDGRSGSDKRWKGQLCVVRGRDGIVLSQFLCLYLSIEESQGGLAETDQRKQIIEYIFTQVTDRVAGNCLPYHPPEFLATKGSK